MNSTDDTICAIITALGGAVGIIRLSGPDADARAAMIWHGRTPLGGLSPRVLSLGTLRDSSGRVLDPECLAVRMPAPNSYTGENVVELQCHGGALCVRLALEELLRCGVRLAEPGEFTKRAFLNGRLDLTQAEAVADVIAASSTAALSVASNQLKGLLGTRLNEQYDALARILADIESRLDFPEEELEWVPVEALARDIQAAVTALSRLLATRRNGEILRDGLSLAIVGCPNVGKSSLLNALLGRNRAIVTPIPGTTRDTIEEHITLRNIRIRLIDTAGIRDGGDSIEQTGMERARECAENADIVLWLFDGTRPYADQAWPGWDIRGTLIQLSSKSDLAPTPPADAPAGCMLGNTIGENGLDALAAAVVQAAGLQTHQDGDIAVAARHAALLEEALAALHGIPELLRDEQLELAAIGLRNAISAVGRIVGRAVEPDVLDTIFHKFCIGK